MENKKSFLAYSDWKGTFDILPDEIAGKLIKHLFAYVNDENPVSDELIVNAVFEPIKATLKRDLCKWEIKTNEKSYNGRLGNLKRYYPDIYEQVKNELITLEKGEELAKVRKDSQGDSVPSLPIANLADSVNVSDSDSDSVNDKINYRAFAHLSISFSEFNKLIEEGFTKEQIDLTINSIENFKKNSKYKSLYLTALNWLKKNHPKANKPIQGETLEQKAYREHVEQALKYRG